MTMKSYDVLICGAGPAGSMAGKTFASKGYSVLIIDMKKRIGSPLQCGEAITEFALKNTKVPIDKTWVKQKVKGVKILLPKNKYFYSTVPGLSIDRVAFDQWLANRATDKGAILQTNTRMKDISGKAGSWTIETTQGTVQSKILFGADGASSKTARILHLLQTRPYVKAFQYKFDIKDLDFPEKKWLCMSMHEMFHGGYGWIFPRDDEFNVGAGNLVGTQHLLNTYCKEMGFDIKKKKSAHAGVVPHLFKMSSYTVDGAAIIGDAAGLTNPVTGGGIHAALYSGTCAATHGISCLEQEDYTKIHRYTEDIRKTEFLNPIHQKTASYFQNWTNTDWDFFGNTAHGLDMGDLGLFRCFLIGLKNPRYFLRSKELLTIRKEMQINQKYGW